jgi:hypothetical protein
MATEIVTRERASARRINPSPAWSLAVGGALFVVGGSMLPTDDLPDLSMAQQLKASPHHYVTPASPVCHAPARPRSSRRLPAASRRSARCCIWCRRPTRTASADTTACRRLPRAGDDQRPDLRLRRRHAICHRRADTHARQPVHRRVRRGRPPPAAPGPGPRRSARKDAGSPAACGPMRCPALSSAHARRGDRPAWTTASRPNHPVHHGHRPRSRDGAIARRAAPPSTRAPLNRGHSDRDTGPSASAPATM